jgi:hypothetical protein
VGRQLELSVVGRRQIFERFFDKCLSVGLCHHH